MDTRKEYKNRLPTEEEIKNSLERYFGFMHSKINTLGDLDFSKTIKMQNKGWYMQSSKEDMQRLIDDFVNIYGYIYREGEYSGLGTFTRGTTTDEAERMNNGRTIPSALSTTTDENIAKRFCEYGKAALIRIKPCKGLPYLYVEDLKGENSENEEEVLILPFAKVKGSQFTSDWQGYKYYDVTLEKAELPEISDESLEELRESSINGYENFAKQLKEYEDLTSQYERATRLHASYDEKQAIYSQIQVLSDSIVNYKSRLQEMLKGLCRQREKDIDLEREDENRRIADERKRKEEERVKKLTEEIEGFRENLSKDYESIKNGTESSVSTLTEIIKRYRNVSNTLGIKTFNSQELEHDLQIRAMRITEGLQQEVTEENPDIEYGILQDMTSKYGTAKTVLEEIPELLEDYEETSMMDLKANLNQKIQEIIYRTKRSRLTEERQVALSQDDTLLNKLLGKTALKQAKVRNIEARMKNAAKKRETSNSIGSVSQMLAEMYKCAYEFNGGQLPEKMQQIEEAIRTAFTNVPDAKSLMQQACNNQVAGVPIVPKKKGIFSWIQNRQEAKRLDNETLEIAKESKSISTSENPDPNAKLTAIYSRYSNALSRIQQLVCENSKQQDMQLENNMIEQN